MTKKTNTPTLFLSELLKTEYKRFWNRFSKNLQEHNVTPQFLPNTADIWARDYMPVQIGPKRFMQFRYEPDYLREYPELRTTPTAVTKSLPKDWEFKTSILNVDGGNVVRHGNTVLMVDKVFHENQVFLVTEVIEMLYDLLEADRIIFLPWDDEDFIGHADGIVRFIDDQTVLINERTDHTNPYFDVALRAALHNAGFKWEVLPLYLPDDPTGVSARGLYLNYLDLGDKLFVPTYGLKSDQPALVQLEKTFGSTKQIIPVPSDEIAREGGVLNCISWEVSE
jgi:agmatine deiminase